MKRQNRDRALAGAVCGSGGRSLFRQSSIFSDVLRFLVPDVESQGMIFERITFNFGKLVITAGVRAIQRQPVREHCSGHEKRAKQGAAPGAFSGEIPPAGGLAVAVGNLADAGCLLA